MSGNKLVYKEAFDRARSGRGRSFVQRLLHPFQDHYTQSSREQGERDGTAARATDTGETTVPAGTAQA